MSNTKSQIPNVTTSCCKSFELLEKKFVDNCESIQEWFKAEWQKTPPPIYGSVDLRNAGFKLSPIDMNLFPAGFNNLNRDYLAFATESAEKTISAKAPETRRMLIIAESHTRNLFYWENINTLLKILSNGGFDVKVAMLSSTDVMSITTPSGETVTIDVLQRTENKLHIDHFIPDFILLNNDLSEGIPPILQGLAQPLMPPAELGWSQRLKSGHFEHFADVVSEFAKLIDIDEWLIAPFFKQCGEVDFMHAEGIECLIHHAEQLFQALHEKYEQYNIKHAPFLVIKADAGTYGHAVMTIRHVDELRNMNRKQRTRMSMSKGKQRVTRVIIQEGVYTFETINDGAVTEPVAYLFGDFVIGGFYRVHKDRGVDESLNAPGMHFEPLPFPMTCHEPCKDLAPTAARNQFYTYGVVAKLSMLAAAREIHEQFTKGV